MSTPTGSKRGFQLRYRDYRKIQEFIEDSYRRKDNDEVIDFNSMDDEIKNLLWKIKTVIRNMESVRLRANEPENKGE